jgi:hypothetical protein
LSGRDLLSAKDNRILELSEQVAELGRKVFDLEENLREKDEVIAARSASARPPVFRLVLRIYDILVWIRIRIRILLFSSLTIKTPTKN